MSNNQIYLCLKVRNSKGIKAFEKVVLHKEISDKANYSWYGLDSNIGKTVLNNLCKNNSTVLFYINPNEKDTAKTGIVFIGILKGFEILTGKRKKACPYQEIPRNFRTNKHRLFLKISKIKYNNNLSHSRFESLNGISLIDIRSGLSRVVTH